MQIIKIKKLKKTLNQRTFLIFIQLVNGLYGVLSRYIWGIIPLYNGIFQLYIHYTGYIFNGGLRKKIEDYFRRKER